MAEIAFETMRAKLEATRGTAESAPTHLLNIEGMITPRQTQYKPREQRGTLAAIYRSIATRKFQEWEGEGDLDVNEIAFWLNMGVAPVTSPTTPASAVLARLWSFVRNVSADNIKAATFFWGDPALNQLKSGFCMLDELVIENDASSEEVATISVKGQGKFPSKVAAPSATASIAGATFPGALMQLWLDTGTDAIGTTEITDRLISAKHTIKTGVKYKWLAGGSEGDLGYVLIGREKIAACETELTLELIDQDQYDNFAASDLIKVRVRHNGALIESVAGPIDFYNYVEIDTYAVPDEIEWGDNEGTNRAITLKFQSAYDSTLGSDLRVAVQNQRTTL